MILKYNETTKCERGHPLTLSELTLFPGSIVELRKVWIKTSDFSGTLFHPDLASFDAPSNRDCTF